MSASMEPRKDDSASWWDTTKASVKQGIEETPRRVERANRFAKDKTFKHMGEVAANWKESFGQAIKGPDDQSGKKLNSDQKKAARLRQVQQIASGVMGLVSLGKDMLDTGFATATAPLAALFPALPAATLTMPYVGMPHAHSHPPSACPFPVPLPSIGMITLGTCVRVTINGMPAARAGDIGIAPTCGGFAPFFQITTGSSNTFIGGNRAARMGDLCKVCTKADERTVKAGKVMAAVGKGASAASKALMVAGHAVAGLGIAADIAEAAVEDDAATASAKALSASMNAAQLAADLAAMAMTKTMGTDPAIPPLAMGGIVMGHPNVLIGGFPMINIPNPVDMLLNKLKRYKAKTPDDPDADGVGGGSCPI